MPNKKKQAEVSPEVATDAAKIAKKIQVPGQTKEQTKLIEQGIRKGIQEYKKQHKANLRDQDKIKKKAAKEKSVGETVVSEEEAIKRSPLFFQLLPWILLVGSWVYFLYASGILA